MSIVTEWISGPLVYPFMQRALVVSARGLLGTWPGREFRSGLSGVVKSGMIWSRGLFDHVATRSKAIFAHDPTALVPAILESTRIKAEVVSKDEREGGLRRILNFGHTIGTRLEAGTAYRRFSHGQASAPGMRGPRSRLVWSGLSCGASPAGQP